MHTSPPPQAFLTSSLAASPQGMAIARVLAAAIAAVDPAKAVQRSLQLNGSRLSVGERTYDLQQIERVWIAAFGKASLPMTQAAAQILGAKLSGGVVVVKSGFIDTPSDSTASMMETGLPDRMQIITAGHPVPDAGSLRAAAAVRKLLKGAGANDLVLALISGGGSALLTSPAADLTLDDLQKLTEALLRSGASITEINTLRKHLENLKGGGLAQAASPAALACLILSDVIGDPLDMIASGPSVADPTTYAQADQILEKYQIKAQVPQPILERLQKGRRAEIPETPKPGDPLFERVYNLVIASNFQAAQSALLQAQSEGFNTLLLTTALQGEARQAGRFLASILRQVRSSAQPAPPPCCLIAGGETTVTLKGKGLGGRNQELALGAVADLAGLERVFLISLASDGDDGPTDAAGAVASGETLARAQALGLDAHDHLARNDAYHFFAPLGDLIRCGPTQTNVNDLTFLFAF
jgi:hydroxypyruvate reductase